MESRKLIDEPICMVGIEAHTQVFHSLLNTPISFLLSKLLF